MLAHIKKLDDCFGPFLVRVSCPCGASRHIEPEALARLVPWSMTLEELAQRMCCSRCNKKAAEVVAVARSRPRGVATNPDSRKEAAPRIARRSENGIFLCLTGCSRARSEYAYALTANCSTAHRQGA